MSGNPTRRPFEKIAEGLLESLAKTEHNPTAGTDIVLRLGDLLKQATEEKSHFYTAACARDAALEIIRLRAALVLRGVEQKAPNT